MINFLFIDGRLFAAQMKTGYEELQFKCGITPLQF